MKVEDAIASAHAGSPPVRSATAAGVVGAVRALRRRPGARARETVPLESLVVDSGAVLQHLRNTVDLLPQTADGSRLEGNNR